MTATLQVKYFKHLDGDVINCLSFLQALFWVFFFGRGFFCLFFFIVLGTEIVVSSVNSFLHICFLQWKETVLCSG